MCYSKPKKQTKVEIQTVTHFTLYQVHLTEDWSLEDINFGYNFEPSVTRLSLVYIWIITQVKGGLFVLCMPQIYQSLMCYSKPKKQTNVDIQTVTHFMLYQVHLTEDWSLEDINFGYNFEPSVTRLSLVYIWITTQVKGGLFALCMLQIYQSLMVNGTINEACKLEKIFVCKHVMTETRSYNDLMYDKMAND